MQAPMYLLDTGILLLLVRGGPLGKHIDATYRLTSAPFRPLVCVVTHAEIWALADRHEWGKKKRECLKQMLDNLVRVDIEKQTVLDAYVEIDSACYKHPKGHKNMGKNDMWIAAVAKVTGATLLTIDNDFDHLSPKLINVVYIDQKKTLEMLKERKKAPTNE
ncbi:MAG: PIN domain-containing protein [Planctomycetes bacterium]|nr:PIN domain-containing protein [Planctomycetota bacterium]